MSPEYIFRFINHLINYLKIAYSLAREAGTNLPQFDNPKKKKVLNINPTDPKTKGVLNP